MYTLKCTVINCNNNDGDNYGLSFFRFPKDEDRCKKWVKFSGRKELEAKETKWLSSCKRICSVHFEERMFSCTHPLRRTLKRCAVPSLLGVSSESLGNEMGKIVRKCVAPNCETKILRGMPVTKRLFSMPAGKESVEWLKFLNINGDVFEKQIFLCEDHFEDKYFTSTLKERLSKFARPTIYTTTVLKDVNINIAPIKHNNQTSTNNEGSTKQAPNCSSDKSHPSSVCLPNVSSNKDYSKEATTLRTKCRLCLDNPGKYAISEDDLAQKISDYIKIKLIQTPNYPQSVCICCKTLLDTLHNFVAKARAANEKLENILNSAAIPEPGPTSRLRALLEKDRVETTQSSVKPNIEKTEDSSSAKFKCELCSETFSRSMEYRRHKKTHSVLYICNRTGCTKTFLSQRRFQIHLNNHVRQMKRETLALRQKRFTCRICKKYFDNMKLLKEHRETHLNYKCPIDDCNTILKTWKTYDVHILLHEDTQQCLCHVCGKTFRTYSYLHSHEKVHKGLRYKCEFCDATYAFKRTQMLHMRLKHKGIRYYCSMCPNSYASSASLRHHEKTHAGRKDHQCNICGKAFYKRQILNEHIQRHQGIKRYQCKVCCKSFVMRRALRIHERVHDGQKLNCTVEGCKKVLLRIDRLRVHLKKAHPEQENIVNT